MKNVFKYLSLIALLSLFNACSDQEFNDPNAASEESASVQFLVNGIEAGMRLELGIYVRVVSTFGRETYYMEPSDPRYTGELLRGPIDGDGFLLTRPWTARYRIVKDCLILMERGQEVGGESGSGIDGFARTMRAYQLLLNLNLTNNNGIRLDDQLGAVASKDSALADIANELDQAYSALNSAGSSFAFNVSSGLAGFDTPASFAQFNRALKARVAMYQGNAQACLDALANSFIDADGNMEEGVYHVFSTGSGDMVNPIYEVPTADFVKFVAHPSFESDAEAGDTRFSSKVVKRVSQTFDNLTSDLGVTISSSNVDPYPIIRNEELVLLRAEANITLENLSAAEGDINAIRGHAGLGDVTLSSAEQALDQLLHERRYSLFAEGHRWIDLRRYSRLNTLPLDRAGDAIITEMPLPTDENQ